MARNSNDYHWLNGMTEKDCYPLPRIDAVLRLVLEYKVLSKIDIHWAFHGVEIGEQSHTLSTLHTTIGAW